MPLRNPDTTKQVLNDFFLKEGSPRVLRFWSLLKGRGLSPRQSEALLVPRLPRRAQAAMPPPHAHVTIRQPSHGHCGRLPSRAFQLSCGTCRTGDPGRPSRLCGSQPQIGALLVGVCSFLLLPSFFAPILHAPPCPHWSQPRCLLPSLASPPFFPGRFQRGSWRLLTAVARPVSCASLGISLYLSEPQLPYLKGIPLRSSQLWTLCLASVGERCLGNKGEVSPEAPSLGCCL